MRKTITRRSFLAGVTAGSASLFIPRDAAAQGRAQMHFTQYHNQTADSSLHVRLTEMWTAVRNETRGRVEAQVFPLNNNIKAAIRRPSLVVGDTVHR
jgi:TRAP-type C4-dicarboxylate transport system substrate-binding protein